MSEEREAILTAHAKELAAMIGPDEGWGMWRDWLKSFVIRMEAVR